MCCFFSSPSQKAIETIFCCLWFNRYQHFDDDNDIKRERERENFSICSIAIVVVVVVAVVVSFFLSFTNCKPFHTHNLMKLSMSLSLHHFFFIVRNIRLALIFILWFVILYIYRRRKSTNKLFSIPWPPFSLRQQQYYISLSFWLFSKLNFTDDGPLIRWAKKKQYHWNYTKIVFTLWNNLLDGKVIRKKWRSSSKKANISLRICWFQGEMKVEMLANQRATKILHAQKYQINEISKNFFSFLNK